MVSAELFGWLVTALCLAGTILNVKQSIWCFRLWMLGNLAWLAVVGVIASAMAVGKLM